MSQSIKKRFSFIIIFMLICVRTLYSSSSIAPQPPETIILKLPQDLWKQWKVLSRYVTEKRGSIEFIPLNQNVKNWSELIFIQYFDNPIDRINSIDDLIKRLRDTVISSYSGSSVSFKIIQKAKSDAIYEWILHEQYENIPPQHVISHVFLNEKGINTVGFNRKFRKMNTDERNKWIKLFEESVSIMNMEEAKNTTQNLSLIDRFKDSLDLGPNFQKWITFNTYVLENGATMVIRIPPWHTAKYVKECLEITTWLALYDSSIEKLFEIEKENIDKKALGKANFHILKKAPSEVIYSFNYPDMKFNLQVTGIVRSFITEQGYYSISYKIGLEENLKEEEAQKWKERLEEITVKDATNGSIQN